MPIMSTLAACFNFVKKMFTGKPKPEVRHVKIVPGSIVDVTRIVAFSILGLQN
jgi:hypothetical protein